MSEHPSLFSPLDAGDIRLKNRIIMAPMSRLRTDKDAAPSHLVAQYFAQRATAGLLISEAIASVPYGDGQAPITGIFTDHQLDAWQWVVSAVHGAGGKIIAQLTHVAKARTATGQETSSWWAMENAVKPVDLSLAEMQRMPADFAAAARRAIEIGFDGVEIHFANGYFFDQLLRPLTNARNDAYGGSLENRTRLTLEIANAVVAAVGAGKVGMRLSPNIVIDGKPDAANFETYSHLIGALSGLNLAYLHIVRITLPGPNTVTDTGVSKLELVDIRRIYAGTIIAAGEFSPGEADDLVSRGIVDAVAFGRPFIANPDLVHRIRIGALLSEPDRSTFYGSGAQGLVDYPALTDLDLVA